MSRLLSTGWMLVFLPFIFSPHTNGATTESPALNKVDVIIEKGRTLLQEGDLVVRLNHDPVSQFIKYFNRNDKSYSHAGIVLFDNGYPYVYHIVNGDENPCEQIKKDSLQHYCDPAKNAGFGIYRYNINSAEVEKLKALVLGWQQEKVRFDYSFNLQTDDRMYCSEMIAKALAKATAGRIKIATTQPTAIETAALSCHLRLPLPVAKTLKLVAIDNLYLDEHCAPIMRYRF